MRQPACNRCGAALTGSPSDSSGYCERCAIEISPTLEASPPDGVPLTLDDGGAAELAAPSGFALGASDDGDARRSVAALRAGDTVGAYTIRGEIGRGGMAVVYRAEQAALHREVAIKVLAEGPGTSRERVERFLREARAAASLTHPNIVRVHDVGEDRGIRFLAMELVEGASLDAYLRAETVDWRMAARIVRDTARALHHAHGEGIVHRDVKPGNILITHDTTESGGVAVKVTDFGLARVEGGRGLTADGTAIGTPAYMSPEQAAGDQQTVGPVTDVYACGAVLYECLTGRPPAIGESVLEVLHAVQAVDPPPVRRLAPGVPVDLATVTEHALRKEVTDRYPTAAALADELDRVLEGAPVQARPISTFSRIIRRVRRHPVVSGAVAAGILGLVVGAGALAVLAGERAAADREARQRLEQEQARLAARRDAQPVYDRAVARLRVARNSRTAGKDADAERALAQARVAIDDVLAAVPDWPEALLVSAQVYLAAGDRDAGLAALDAAIAANPKLTAAYYERVRLRFHRYFATNVLAGLHDPAAAAPLEADLAQLVSLDASPERANAARAMAALFTGDYTAAATAIEAALAEDPYFADAFALRGAIHMGQGTAWLWQGEPRNATESFRKAVTDFDAAIANGADPDLILAGRAHVRSQLRKFREALADADRLIQLDPDDPSRWFLRARLRRLSGDRDGAAVDLAKGRELGGDTAETHLQAVTVLLAELQYGAKKGRRATDDLAAARADLDWVIANAPKHAEARFYRAVVYNHEGNTAACVADLQAFLAQEGGTAAYRQMATALLQHLDKAEPTPQTVIRLGPLQDLAELQTQYAQALKLVKSGRIHDSADLYSALLEKLDRFEATVQVQVESVERGGLIERLRGSGRLADKRGSTRREAHAEQKATAEAQDQVSAGGSASGHAGADAGAARPRPVPPATPSEAAPEPSAPRKDDDTEVESKKNAPRAGEKGKWGEPAAEQVERWLRQRLEWGKEYTAQMRQIAHYNIACSEALKLREAPDGPEAAAHRQRALAHLAKSIAAGWADVRHLEMDEDLSALRGDPDFQRLHAQCGAAARERSAQMRARVKAAQAERAGDDDENDD